MLMKYLICVANLLLACAANASSQPQTPEEFVFAELAICIQSGGCAIVGDAIETSPQASLSGRVVMMLLPEPFVYSGHCRAKGLLFMQKTFATPQRIEFVELASFTNRQDCVGINDWLVLSANTTSEDLAAFEASLKDNTKLSVAGNKLFLSKEGTFAGKITRISAIRTRDKHQAPAVIYGIDVEGLWCAPAHPSCRNSFYLNPRTGDFDIEDGM
jgi:hypothetical protein